MDACQLTETGHPSRPLRVTAILANGFVAADPWSPSIDAILAYAALKVRFGPALLNMDPHRDGVICEPLPLVRLGLSTWSTGVDGDDWYYACSSPIHAGAEHVSHFHRRFDDQHERYLDAGKRRLINTKSGRYKSYRLTAVKRLASSVSWFVLGNGDAIRNLLSQIDAIGKKRAHGDGLVLEWQVQPSTDEDAEAWAELATLCRPVPCSHTSPQPDDLRMYWGIRPPMWLVAHRRLCVMPRPL